MGMTEKENLINSITIKFVEEFGLNLKDCKLLLSDILQNYHVQANKEKCNGSDFSTSYLMAKFHAGKKAAGMNEKTISQYVIAVKKLEEYTGKQLADVESEDIQFYLTEYRKTVSSVTVRAKYQLLSSVFNYLYLHNLINFNPISYVDPPKADVIFKKPVTDYDIEKVKRVCETLPKEKEGIRDTALIYFFISTGCRVSELCNIKLKDVDLERKVCKVMGKGHKERIVIINDKTIYRLKLYLDTRKNKNPDAPLFAHIRGEEKHMTKDGVGRIIRSLKDKADLNNLTCHSFRRFYATELRKRNVPIQMIANSLGHANLNQINRYSLYDDTELENAIRQAI